MHTCTASPKSNSRLNLLRLKKYCVVICKNKSSLAGLCLGLTCDDLLRKSAVMEPNINYFNEA